LAHVLDTCGSCLRDQLLLQFGELLVEEGGACWRKRHRRIKAWETSYYGLIDLEALWRLKFDQSRVYEQSQNAFRSAVSAGAINGHDQITKLNGF